MAAMESGSLLPEALRHMELQRQLEDDVFFFSSGANLSNEESDDKSSLVQNAVIISVYPLDDSSDDVAGEKARTSNTTTSSSGSGSNTGASTTRVHVLLEKVANLGHILNHIILPRLHRAMPYPWHLGGDGLVFGAECDDDGNPHLKAVLRFGHCVDDEWYAVAAMYHIAEILRSSEFGGQRVAVEMIDADDGQFLLIEAAECLPQWVDELGADGMINRVWICDGSLRLVPPLMPDQEATSCSGIGSSNSCALTRAQALQALLSMPSDVTEAPIEVQNSILFNKVQPYLEAIRSPSSGLPPSISEHLHRAALIVPLKVAILVRDRPDLIPVAVHAFCRYEGQQSIRGSRERTATNIGTGLDNGSTDNVGPALPFERLVTTVITLSRTTYAILLTGEGMLPPPFAVPTEYRSVELNRMRRRLKNEALTDRFRHALEGGIRLSRGFDHLLRGAKVGGSIAQDGSSKPEFSLGDNEQRVCFHWSRLCAELGADAGWIRNAWIAGPNRTEDSKSCIDAFLRCPVYRPEISHGGVWPLSHPGKSVWKVLCDAFRGASKSNLTEGDFAMTREDQVDSDKWLDLDTQEIAENRMKDVAFVTPRTDHCNETYTDGEMRPAGDKIQAQSVDDMLSGLQSFVQSKSDVEGVHTRDVAARMSSEETAAAVLSSGKAILKRDFDINPKVFVGLLHQSLKIPCRIEESETRPSRNSMIKHSAYTSRSDIDLFFYADDSQQEDVGSDSGSSSCVDDVHVHAGGGSGGEGEGMNSIRDVMAAMDEQLSHTRVERGQEGSVQMLNDEGEDLSGAVSAMDPSDGLSVDVSVISNILKSLDAQGGGSGPASNILKEFGVDFHGQSSP